MRNPSAQPLDLHELLTVLDSAEQAAGWDGPPQLVGVSGKQLSYVSMPGHPYDTLLGFTAWPEWEAIAIIAEGWGATMADGTADYVRGTMTQRPSRTFGRRRMRTIAIFDRAGGELSGLRWKDGEFKVMEEPGVGRIGDAARRALGLPTPPPGFPVAEYLAQRWLAGIAASVKRGKHQPKVTDVKPLHFPNELLTADHAEGWDVLRRITARGHFETSVTPEHAAWMDAGIFARALIGELPPLDDLAKQARRRVDAAGRQCIDECLARLQRGRAA